MAMLASLPWPDVLLGIVAVFDGARLIDDSLWRWPGVALAGVGRRRRNARPLDGGTLVQVQPSCCPSQLNTIADTPVLEEKRLRARRVPTSTAFGVAPPP